MRSPALRGTVAGLLLLLFTGGGAITALTVDPPRAHAADDRFWTDDTSFYRSPWYAGRHRVMIPFGCTEAPYYDPDPRCPRQQGFHHGLDIAMRCGARLYSDVRGRVVDPRAAGALGSSYGAKAFRIRHDGHDFVFGHVRRVYVEPGDLVRRGDLVARAGALGAPDGCHLHFEARPAGGGYLTALRPRPFLSLDRVG